MNMYLQSSVTLYTYFVYYSPNYKAQIWFETSIWLYLATEWSFSVYSFQSHIGIFVFSPLHYASGMTGPTDVLDLLIEYGANVDAVNEDHCTPLFFATQANNFFGAGALLLAGRYSPEHMFL